MFFLNLLHHHQESGADSKLAPGKRAAHEEDDCSSVCTARTAESTLSLSTCDASVLLSECSSKKSVRFNLQQNESYDNTQICEEDCKDLWYDSVDFKRFKRQQSELAKAIVNDERTASVRADSCSYAKVVFRAHEVCRCVVSETYAGDGPILSQAEQGRLSACFRAFPDRFGLERWAVRSVARERSLRRQEMVDTVLALQEMRGDTSSTDQFVRLSAERISRPSRLYAREVAWALAGSL